MQTLVAFQAFVAEKYAPKTAKMYFGDVRELSIYLKNKKVKDVSSHDLQQWIGSLVSPDGKGLERKTVNRKVSAIITYFLWLQGVGAITRDPTLSLNNARIQSPLPDYLYENEIEILSKEASADPRLYLLVLLFLDTGMKSNELFLLTKAHVDISERVMHFIRSQPLVNRTFKRIAGHCDWVSTAVLGSGMAGVASQTQS